MGIDYEFCNARPFYNHCIRILTTSNVIPTNVMYCDVKITNRASECLSGIRAAAHAVWRRAACVAETVCCWYVITLCATCHHQLGLRTETICWIIRWSTTCSGWLAGMFAVGMRGNVPHVVRRGTRGDVRRHKDSHGYLEHWCVPKLHRFATLRSRCQRIECATI